MKIAGECLHLTLREKFSTLSSLIYRKVTNKALQKAKESQYCLVLAILQHQKLILDWSIDHKSNPISHLLKDRCYGLHVLVFHPTKGVFRLGNGDRLNWVKDSRLIRAMFCYEFVNFECTSGRNCALVSVIQWQNGTIVYHLVFIGPNTSIACLPLFRVTVDPLNTTHVSVSNLSTQPSNFHKI